MKKTLLLQLLTLSVIQLQAQTPRVSGVTKADLTNTQSTRADGIQSNFYTNAISAQRNSNPTIQTQGTQFSSSYNCLTLLVSQSHCLTADQALNAVMMTHRISSDWPADANVDSGYIEYSWTSNFGTSWDSSYYADQGASLSKYFRYPSGAIINPAGNTTIANAMNVSIGPWTNGATSGLIWPGYYVNSQLMMNGATASTNVYTAVNPLTVVTYFPRIDITSYDDSSAWGTSGLYTDPSLATGAGFRGACLLKAQYAAGNVVWSFDSIKPNFHTASNGDADAFTISHLSFSRDGQVGYCVFFGVDASASTPETRTFSPIVYKSTNHGLTWSMLPMHDFSNFANIANYLIPSTDGSLKPFFSQSQGSDIIVDNNNELHIICTIESGASNDDDSLGYTWTLTGVNGTRGRHYIYDISTSGSIWKSALIDSVMTTTTSTTSIFIDGSSSTAYNTDARIQVSHTTDRSKLFVVWVDSDPFAASAENALPDLFGRGLDWGAGTMTTRKQFTSSQDFYWDYVSNVALVNGNVFNIGVTNSIDRSGNHDVLGTFDHYFYDQCMFNTSEFTFQMPISLDGVDEHNASFGSFTTYPNPASGFVNVNLNLVHSAAVNISIVNTLGQTVLTENRMLNGGANLVQLNTSALTTGVYFVTVSSDNNSATSKIVIQ